MSSPSSSEADAQTFAPGWIDGIEWRAFDEVAFLSASGAKIGADARLPERLRAMHACFPRQKNSGELPLDIAQFDRESVARFVAGVMETIGHDEALYAEGDEAFSQDLFKRWFLQLASPVSGDGNGGMLTAPFHGALLHLTHPSNSPRHRCSGGPDSEAASPLPHIDALKQDLRHRFLRGYGDVNIGFGHEGEEWAEWVFDGLCQLFEPALLRKDLPEGFRYGSLDWALLSLGIDLAGDAHAGMSRQALISLGATMGAHYFSDPGDEKPPAFSQGSIQIMLTMAHVHGQIKLRNTRDVQQSDVETALLFFQSQLFSVERTQGPLEELAGKIPTRRAVAETVLSEHGIDPARLFFLPPRTDGGMAPQRLHRIHCPAEPQRCMTAAELFMRGELPQLRERGGLGRREAPLPEDLSGFTVERLSKRFGQEFKAALTPLTHRILIPALQDRINSMDKDSEEFWRCGKWTVRVPKIQGVTDHWSGGFRGGVGIGSSATSSVEYKAQDSVLVRLTLGEGGRQRVQTYLVRLEPFQLQRYHGEDKALLERELHHLFKPANDKDVLLRLNSRAGVHYEDHTADGGKTLLQTISERLPDRRITLLYKDAYQITEPELFEERLRDGLMGLLPLYSCIQAGTEGNAGAAAVYCTLDLLGMLKTVSAGTKLATAARLSRANMKNVARAFVQKIVDQGSAHRTIHTILTLGKKAARTAKAGIAAIDPGFGLLRGLAKLPFQFAPMAWKQLRKAFTRHPDLRPFAAQLDAAEKLALKCYPDGGFWRARQGAITKRNGRRSAVLGKKYDIYAVGDTSDVLVMRDGSGFRLANPQSGRGFGPLLRKGMVKGRLELASAANRGGDGVPAASKEKFEKAFAAVCRVRRAGDAAGACSLRPDPRFGENGYSKDSAPPFKVYQFPITGISRGHAKLKRIVTTNPFDIGFSTQVENISGGRTDIVPDSAVRFVHHPGGVNGPQSALHLPQTIEGRIQSLPSKDGGRMIDYAAVTLSHRDEMTEATIHTTRYVPLGTYRERDGTVVALCYFDPSTPYSVRIDPDRLPLGEDGLAITLKRANPAEIEKFWRFQSLLSIDQRSAFPLVADAVKLADASAELKERFETVFSRAEGMLNDAIRVMEDEQLKPLVMKMAAKLFGMPDGEMLEDDLYPMLNTIWGHLTKMRDSLPYLKEQSPHVIGFFKGGEGAEAGLVTGNAFVKSMYPEISFDEMNKPLITLAEEYFKDPLKVLNMQAATLLHEWSHALRGTSDKMHPYSDDTVYALVHDETIDLSPLTEAASQLGSDPANHAPTIEHFLAMAAALRHEDTKQSVMSYIHTPDNHSYRRTVTTEDFGAMLGLLGDIVDRSKRKASAPGADWKSL